jgi:3,4-dihydroxy 2-butanone 4-phosphate synthase/GTP cyclohydrolase II
MSELSTIDEAISWIKQGRVVIVVDDENRENEGDLVLAAEFITPEKVNFLTKYARGLICVPMPRKRIDELKLTPMVQFNTALNGTKFTVSVLRSR